MQMLAGCLPTLLTYSNVSVHFFFFYFLRFTIKMGAFFIFLLKDAKLWSLENIYYSYGLQRIFKFRLVTVMLCTDLLVSLSDISFIIIILVAS